MQSRLHPTLPLIILCRILAVAWLVAVLPAGTGRAVFTWLSEGAHFSHQHELSHRVAALLGDVRTAEPVALAAAPEAPPRPLPALPGTPDPTDKKLDVPLPRGGAVVTGTMAQTCDYFDGWKPSRGLRRAAPPHGPPRAG